MKRERARRGETRFRDGTDTTDRPPVSPGGPPPRPTEHWKGSLLCTVEDRTVCGRGNRIARFEDTLARSTDLFAPRFSESLESTERFFFPFSTPNYVFSSLACFNGVTYNFRAIRFVNVKGSFLRSLNFLPVISRVLRAV